MKSIMKLLREVKAFLKPCKLNAAELSDTAYIISLLALLLSFVSILLATR